MPITLPLPTLLRTVLLVAIGPERSAGLAHKGADGDRCGLGWLEALRIRDAQQGVPRRAELVEFDGLASRAESHTHSVQWVGHCITLVYGKEPPATGESCAQPTLGSEVLDVHPIAAPRCLLTRSQHSCKRAVQDFQAVTSKY
uniref:Uncharacterized protein n=1 Tax=Ralstonia solanacearum TaxID=305 RepID=A0A0S4TZB9_RALSL|nr:protein of unknown function [Ralstonia solanacearum]